MNDNDYQNQIEIEGAGVLDNDYQNQRGGHPRK